MKERRRTHRDAASPYYCGFTDRRQPVGIVTTWHRTVGGEWIRVRRNLAHLADVLVAKRGPTPDEQADASVVPVAALGTLTWADESAPFPAGRYRRRPFLMRKWPARLRLWRSRLHRQITQGAWS